MKRSKNYFFADMLTMLQRSLRHIFRSFDTIVTVTFTPIAIMLLFVYVLGGSMQANMNTKEYVTYMLPGIIVMAIASGIAYSALRLYNDIQSGIFDRFHAMPVSKAATLWAHVLTSLVSNMLSIVLIFGVAFLMGFRTSASLMNWFIVFALIVLLIVSLTWLAIVAGLKAKSPDGASAFSYPLVFLPFLSSTFVPVDTMPTAVRVFAENQPITAIVDSMRCAFNNQVITNDIWNALTWLIVILLITYFYAMHVYKQKTK